MNCRVASAILVVAAAPLCAHRLDEYLQGALIAVERSRVQAEVTLTPGVAVVPFVMSAVDKNADGVISEPEQRAYGARLLQDFTLKIDSRRLAPEVVSLRFPAVDEMKEGRGEIQLVLSADLPKGGRNRKLTFENHHLSRIAAYQVNCLVPRDPRINIASQHRNYAQSFYELEYEDRGAPTGRLADSLIWLSPFVLLLAIRISFVRHHRRPAWVWSVLHRKSATR
jgi:hypothetical protein